MGGKAEDKERKVSKRGKEGCRETMKLREPSSCKVVVGFL